MKNMLSLVLALAMLFLLCACGAVEEQTSTTAAPETGLRYDGSQVTIVFEHDFSANKQQILDKYLAMFQAQYPNITVEQRFVGNADDIFERVRTLKSSGKYANVVICRPDHVQSYMDWNIIASMDDMIGSTLQQPLADGTENFFGLTDAQKDDFVAAFYEEGIYNGSRYSLPLTRYGNVLYYNQDFFTANELSVPATWEDMEALCQQIRQIDPESTPLLVQTDDWLYYTLCAQNGQDISDPRELFDSEKAKDVMAKLYRWKEARYLATPQELGCPTFADTGDFARCYMVIDRSYGGGYYYSDFEVGVAAVPKGEMLTCGADLCILNKDNVQEVLASWLLVKFLTTNADFQAELAMYGGYLPVISSASQTASFAEYISGADGKENLDALSVKCCMNAAGYYPLPAFTGLDGLGKAIDNLIYQCLYVESEDIEAKIQSELQKLYDQYAK